MGPSAGQWCKAHHEEMKPGEGHHVHSQFSQVGIELTRESKTDGNTRHNCRDQVVKVTIGRRSQFQGAHADVVEGLR